MGELCRSAEMEYITIHCPDEQAFAFADQMCREDLVAFSDLNENVQIFDRHYQKEIMRIHEAQRALRTVATQFVTFGALTEEELDVDEKLLKNTPLPPDSDIYSLVDDITKFYRELGTSVTAEQNLAMQVEMEKNRLEVLRCMEVFREGAPELRRDSNAMEGMGVPLVTTNDAEVGFKYLAGVCPVVKIQSLRKQIFHITRGNRYFRSETLEDGKAAFIVYFIGDWVRNMIHRFCKYMDVEIFVDSAEDTNTVEMKQEVEIRIHDYENTLNITRKDLTRTMEHRAEEVRQWNIQLKQEMAIRVLLNKFKQQNQSLNAEGWVAAANLQRVKDAFPKHSSNPGIVTRVEAHDIPRRGGKKPTYFEVNEFTAAFQMLINTYGIPRNGEFNPAVPSIITFPFLFAMMYADVFHGSFLFLGGCYLLYNAKANSESKNELMAGLHMGRYVIFMMGMFAIYNGLIYNDVTSISINGFNGTQWHTVQPAGYKNPVVNGKVTGVYAFGVDPVWSISSLQLSYMNSLKMKLSVLVGITQMTFGLFLKLGNHIHEGDYLSIFGEFVPQMIFMFSFFNYMQFIIIYKWCNNWVGKSPPSLITVLVEMVLNPGGIEKGKSELYDSDLQATVQVSFLLAMFCAVPWMLFVKPLVIRSRMNAAEAARGNHQALGEDPEDHQLVEHGHGDHDEEHTFGEVMIHQVIHTIEYVLGTISNTASYLRLWALSLAHAQLAEVFYDKTILSGMQSGSGLMVFVTCAMFFGMTVAVLMCMDVLECFLHALRLHWVEFQNKFYYADGEEFLPFSYSQFAQGGV